VKIISSPREIEIQFLSMDDLEVHVKNLQAMLEHNKSHQRGEKPHLSYIIEPSSPDYDARFKVLRSDGSSSEVQCRKCMTTFVVDPCLEDNVIALRVDMDSAPVLKTLCPNCGNVDL
jgi:Fe-S-cluster-containing hydrogenase component 2